MATVFTVNTPVTTRVNFVDVQNNLPVGAHTFQLEVVDDQGNRSSPVRARVVVQGTVIVPGRGGTGGGPVIIGGPVITPAPVAPAAGVNPRRPRGKSKSKRKPRRSE